MSRPSHHYFFDPATSTLTYVVWDPVTRDAVVIDPVMDFDPITQMRSKASLSRVLKFIELEGLRVHWTLDTHAHADHLTGSTELRRSGISWGTGERMFDVFKTFKGVFRWPEGLRLEDLGVERWFRDGEEFTAGSLRLQTIFTPGHTSACLTYRVGEWLFTGDAIFMPDYGVGRCDFPGGSAATLYDSIMGRLYAMPDRFRVFTGHDYMPGGRTLRYECSLGEQKASNVHLNLGTSREEFIRFREARDKTLSSPRLLNPSLEWNLGAAREA